MPGPGVRSPLGHAGLRGSSIRPQAPRFPVWSPGQEALLARRCPLRTQASWAASLLPLRAHRLSEGKLRHPSPWTVPRYPPGLPLPASHPHAHATSTWPGARSAGARRGREGSLHSREANTSSVANFRRALSGRAMFEDHFRAPGWGGPARAPSGRGPAASAPRGEGAWTAGSGVSGD